MFVSPFPDPAAQKTRGKQKNAAAFVQL